MDPTNMDPQMMAAMLAQMMQQGGYRENPLGRMFSAPPMYAGVPQRPSQMFDFSGLPGMQQGNPFSMMAGMALQSALPSIMGPDFIPGQFSPTQNLYDHRRSTNYFAEQRRAMEEASNRDRDTYQRMIRGVDRMTGMGMPEDQQKRLAGDITSMMPILSQFMGPELTDQLHGVRGSRAQFAQGMFEGGRYRFDPISGRLGLSGATAGAMTNEIGDMLYGPGADVTRMRGIGGGAAGRMFDEMTRRGLMPGMLDQDQIRSGLVRELSQSRDNISSPGLRALQDKIGIGATSDPRQLAKLQEEVAKLDPQAFEAASRSFDATRTKQAMEKMSGAVAAMRDIFGDMGKPNAPMIEILNGLNSMTQGGLTGMSPDRLERAVRDTYNVARATGLGLEGIMGFAGTAGNLLQAQGQSRGLAPQVAQGSAAYGMAYGLRGTPTGMDIFNKEQASQVDLALRSQFASSPQAVRLGALMQMNDQLQRTDREGKTVTGFTSGSEAAAMAAAIKAGETSFEFNGQRRSVFRSQQDMTNILVAGGMDRRAAQNLMMSNPHLFREQIDRYNLTGIGREAQLQNDMRPRLSQAFGEGASVALADTKMTQDQRNKLSPRLGNAIFEAYQDITENNRELLNSGNEVDLNRNIAGRLRSQFGTELRGMSDAQLANLVGQSTTASNNFILGSPSLNSARDVRNLFLMGDRRTLGTQGRIIDNAKAVSRVQSALSGLGQEKLVSRISDYLQQVPEGGGTIRGLVSRMLGGIDKGDATDSATALVENLSNLRGQYENASGGDRNKILKEIETIVPDVSRALEGNISNLSPAARKIIEQYKEAEARRPRQPDPAPTVPLREPSINTGLSSNREVRLQAGNVTVQQSAVGTASQVASATNPGTQRLNGELVITGLNRAIIQAALSGNAGGDTRSPTT